jgi:hypothetical protein
MILSYPVLWLGTDTSSTFPAVVLPYDSVIKTRSELMMQVTER